MSAHCSMAWMSMAADVCSWIIRITHGFFWLLLSANGCSWVLMIAHEHSWAAKNVPELGAMEQWALIRAQEQSWAWRHGTRGAHQQSWALMAPQPHTYQCFWVLISAHEHLWELMSTHENSWVLKCFIKKETKMLTFTFTSSWYFANISVHTSPNNKNFIVLCPPTPLIGNPAFLAQYF